MINFKLFTFLLTSILILGGCNNDSTAEISHSLTEPAQVPQAPEIIPDTLSSKVLVAQNWKITFVSVNGKIEDKHDHRNNHITFDKEGNYVWTGDNVKNEGRWELSDDNDKLLLESSDIDLTSEWTVKHKRSAMVWVGTSKYGHQSTQMMLNAVREFEVPE